MFLCRSLDLKPSLASNTTVARPLKSRCRSASDRIAKFVQRAALISGDEQGVADQIGFDVVEPQNVQPHIPLDGEKPHF